MKKLLLLFFVIFYQHVNAQTFSWYKSDSTATGIVWRNLTIIAANHGHDRFFYNASDLNQPIEFTVVKDTSVQNCLLYFVQSSEKNNYVIAVKKDLQIATINTMDGKLVSDLYLENNRMIIKDTAVKRDDGISSSDVANFLKILSLLM